MHAVRALRLRLQNRNEEKEEMLRFSQEGMEEGRNHGIGSQCRIIERWGFSGASIWLVQSGCWVPHCSFVIHLCIGCLNLHLFLLNQQIQEKLRVNKGMNKNFTLKLVSEQVNG